MKDRPLIFVKLLQDGNGVAQAQPFDRSTSARKAAADGNAVEPLPSKKPASGVPLDISDRIIDFRFEDEERKADKLEITLDNYDMEEFDNPAWKKGGILEVSWGYPGNMTKPRRVVIQKVSGNYLLKVEAHGLEMLMHKITTVKVYHGKTLYQIATEVMNEYASVLSISDADVRTSLTLKGAAEDAKTAGFDGWYAQQAVKLNLDPNPDNKRHFYDFRALYEDVISGKTVEPTSVADLPEVYKLGVPSMWLRNEDGNLYDARTGREISDSEVAKVAASATSSRVPVNEINISEEARGIRISSASQSAQTHAQFVVGLARRYGFHFYIDDKGFHFVPVDSVYKKRPAKTLSWFNGAGEWIDFHYENDGTRKPAKIRAKGVNPLTGRAYETMAGNEETARNGLAPRIVEMSDKTAVQTQTNRVPKSFLDQLKDAQPAIDRALKGLAQSGGPKPDNSVEEDVGPVAHSDEDTARVSTHGKYKKKSRHCHGLSGTIIGDPTFEAKTVIQVEGIGRRLSGKWAVKSVETRIDSSGYVNTFKADRDGDHGYGQKGETTSKATQNKQTPKPSEEGATEPLHKIEQRTGQTWETTRIKKAGT